MRRVNVEGPESAYDGGQDKESRQGNYVSFTIWNKKSDFSAWRSGEAFKEAHGGTSIGAFLSTMVNSALVLQGPPRPAFYDGLLVQSTKPTELPDLVDGWRNMVDVADGVSTLPTECFIACNQFYVPPQNAVEFEQRWATRESALKECEGFVCFAMMRRDGQQKGHGTVEIQEGEPTYVSTTIWQNRQCFENWKNGQAFQKAHGNGQQAKDVKTNDEGSSQPQQSAPPKQPLWNRPPQPVFYEGTLVITSEDGA
jgi:heme-degrading monooxygenase HmoA